MLIKNRYLMTFIFSVFLLFSACTSEQLNGLNSTLNFKDGNSTDKELGNSSIEDREEKDIVKDNFIDSNNNSKIEDIEKSNNSGLTIFYNKTFGLDIDEKVEFTNILGNKMEIFILSPGKEEKILLSIFDGIEVREVELEGGKEIKFDNFTLTGLDFVRSNRLTVPSSYLLNLEGELTSLEILEREAKIQNKLGELNEKFNISIESFSSILFSYKNVSYDIIAEKVISSGAIIRLNGNNVILRVGENINIEGINIELERTENTDTVEKIPNANVLISDEIEIVDNRDIEGIEVIGNISENLESFEILFEKIRERDSSLFRIEDIFYTLNVSIINEKRVLLSINGQSESIDVGDSEEIMGLNITPLEVFLSTNQNSKNSLNMKITKEKALDSFEKEFSLTENEAVSFEDSKGNKHTLTLKKVDSLEDKIYLETSLEENFIIQEDIKNSQKFEEFEITLVDFLYTTRISVPSIIRFKITGNISNFNEEGLQLNDLGFQGNFSEKFKLQEIESGSKGTFLLKNKTNTFQIKTIRKISEVLTASGKINDEVFNLVEGESQNVGDLKIEDINIDFGKSIEDPAKVSFEINEKTVEFKVDNGDIIETQNGNTTTITINQISHGGEANFDIGQENHYLQILLISEEKIMISFDGFMHIIDVEEDVILSNLTFNVNNVNIPLDKTEASTVDILIQS